MSFDKIYQMSFSKVYPLLVNKALKKGRTKAEVDEIIRWLTGGLSVVVKLFCNTCG